MLEGVLSQIRSAGASTPYTPAEKAGVIVGLSDAYGAFSYFSFAKHSSTSDPCCAPKRAARAHESVRARPLSLRTPGRIGRAADARKLLKDALVEFEGSPQKGRLIIAECQLSLGEGDVEGALKALRGVRKESPAFLAAKTAIANIYLVHLKDKARDGSSHNTARHNTPDSAHCAALCFVLKLRVCDNFLLAPRAGWVRSLLRGGCEGAPSL